MKHSFTTHGYGVNAFFIFGGLAAYDSANTVFGGVSMDRIQDGRYSFGGDIREREAAPLGFLLLAVLLAGVFFLAVGAYGIFTADGDFAEGELPNAVLVFREFVEESESVSVFLGFSDAEDVDASTSEDEDYLTRVQQAAEEYIRLHEAG